MIDFNKKRKKWIIIMIVFGVIYSIIAARCSSHLFIDSFATFNSTTINGKLTYLGIRQKGDGFKIEDKETIFIFYPYTSELNEKNIFGYFAEPGDSVYKAAYSDTLKLFKNNKVYLYTFQKP